MSPDRPDLEELLAQADWLRRLATALVRDPARADDLVQDTYVAALRGAPRAGPGELRRWRATVARNFARRERRDESVRHSHELHAARGERIDGPDAIALRVQLQQELAEAVMALAEPYRTAVVLRHFDGLTHEDIAGKLGITTESARQRVARGVAQLRERLDRRHGGRAAWCALLGRFASPANHMSPPHPLAAPLLAMTAKTKIAVLAVVALLALTTWLWKEQKSSPGSESTAVTPIATPTVPDAALGRGVDEIVGGEQQRSAIVAQASAVAPTAAAEDGALSGIVLDSHEVPIADATIEAWESISASYNVLDMSLWPQRSRAGTTKSDAKGEFQLALPPARPFQITVSAAGFADTVLGKRYAGSHLVVHMLPGGILEGHITLAPSALPARGARVRCFLLGNDAPDGARHEQTTSADDGGFYRIAGVPPGPRCIEIDAEGAPSSGWLKVEIDAGQTTVKDIQIAAARFVRGFVRAAGTHEPIAGALVSDNWTYSRPCKSALDGSFALPVPPEKLWSVHVRADGYGDSEHDLQGQPTDRDIEGLVFELRTARSVLGRVLAPDGSGVEGAYVAACASEYGEVQRIDWRSARTNANGAYAIHGLRRDLMHTLFVQSAKHGTLVCEFPLDEAINEVIHLPDVVLAPAAALHGIVVDARGKPVADRQVKLLGTNADRQRWAERTSISLNYYVAERPGRTDEQGRFAFDELAAGEYHVQVELPGHRDPTRVSVLVQAGETKRDVRIELPDGLALGGVVKDHAGKPVAGVYVSIEPLEPAGGNIDVQTDKRGRFSAEGLASVKYCLQLWPPRPNADDAGEHPIHTLIASVEAGRTDLEIVMQRGVWIVGTVKDASAKPADHIVVAALGPEGQQVDSTVTGLDGRFRLFVESGVAFDLVARAKIEGSAPPEIDSDQDEAHAGRLHGVLGGGAELVITLPPR